MRAGDNISLSGNTGSLRPGHLNASDRQAICSTITLKGKFASTEPGIALYSHVRPFPEIHAAGTEDREIRHVRMHKRRKDHAHESIRHSPNAGQPQQAIHQHSRKVHLSSGLPPASRRVGSAFEDNRDDRHGK
jgi:hypothetical protein